MKGLKMSLFSKRLSELIENTGIKKNELADAIGVSSPQITYYLGNREPNYDKLVEIANYFDVTIDYLLGKEEHKKEREKTMQEHIGEIVSGSNSAKTLLEEYSIEDLLGHYFTNLIDIASTDVMKFDNKELYAMIQDFNTALSLIVSIGHKLNNDSFDIFDEMRKARSRIEKIRLIMINNMTRILEHIYDTDSVPQEIRDRITSNRSFSFKEKSNRKPSDEFTTKATESGE